MSLKIQLLSNSPAAQSRKEWNLSVDCMKIQLFQIRQLPNLGRNGTCQLIVIKIQLFQIHQLPNLWRNGTCQLIVMKIQLLFMSTVRQLPNLGRNGTCQLIVNSNSPAAQSLESQHLSKISLQLPSCPSRKEWNLSVDCYEDTAFKFASCRNGTVS